MQFLRLKGAPLSSSIINAIARGIVIANDRMLLVENGGHLSFSDSWSSIEHEGTKTFSILMAMLTL